MQFDLYRSVELDVAFSGDCEIFGTYNESKNVQINSGLIFSQNFVIYSNKSCAYKYTVLLHKTPKKFRIADFVCV